MGEEVGKPILAGNTPMQFVAPMLNQRRLIRSTKNPMDKCTIVSIFPKQISEIKCTIEPGRFDIAPGTYDNPSLLVIGSSSWWKEIGEDQPWLEIPVSSIQVADSVVKDYCNGMIACNMADVMPGLFFVMGVQTKMDIQMKFKDSLNEAKAKQDKWYSLLIRLADSLWARSNGNPLVISDEMRLAARSLGVDKEWIKDFQITELVRCKFCGGMRNVDYPICPACKAIDPEHALAKEIKFAM